jgi:glycosyltransferase involved in cell wall biosynthesis
MRIVVAHESVDTEGGVEAYLLSVVPALRQRGHEVALVHYRGNGSRAPLAAAVELALGVEDRGLEDVFSALAAWRPDVAFSHNMGPLAVDRQLLARWPVVKMLHGYFGTCVSGLKMHAFPAPCACERAFGPACVALYVPRRCGALSAGALVKGYRWALEQRALFDRYASAVVASQHMRDEMARNGLRDEQLEVVPLFPTVESDAIAPGGERDTVLFAGRMTALKGGQVLVGAAARAARLIGRPVRLLMAGDGPQAESWRARAAGLGVPLEMPGWVRREDRAGVYARCAIVAMPSLWPEPFGLSGLDAASLGRPAVAFDVGGIREWLVDGANGRLIPPRDGEDGLARGIAALLDRPDERARMGDRALEVARRLSLATHVERLEGVLRRAASA